MKRNNIWLAGIAILSNIVMVQNVQAQLSSATVSEIEKSIDEIRNVCSMTDDLEAIGWGIAKPVEIFSKIGSESIPYLTEVLLDQTEDYKTRFFAAVILREVLPDKQSAPYLLKVFQDMNEPDILRMECVTGIGFIGDTAVTETLIDYLDTPSVRLKITIINTLGALVDKRSIPYLINLLEDTNKDIQMVSARALGLIGDESALGVLMKKIQEENPTNDRYVNIVKAHAITALVSIGGNGVEDFLIEILSNSNSISVDLRIDVVIALGKLKSKKVASLLIKQLQTDNELLRMHVTKSLSLMEVVEAEQPIKEAVNKTKSEYVKFMMSKALDKLINR